MKKRFTVLQTVMLVALAVAVTFTVTYYSSYRKLSDSVYEAVGSTNDLKRLTEIQELVDKYFVGEYDPDDAMDESLAGYVAGLGDTWSYYMSSEEYASYKDSRESTYSGIGVSANVDADTNNLVVLTVYEGSPAEKAGIQPLDQIATADGESTAELGFEGAVAKIRGEAGTSVKLGIVRGDKTFDVDVERQSITVQYATGKMTEGDIGYIRITEFSSLADEQFILAADKLRSEGATSLVIDVRNNPGGSLTTLLTILDYIFDEEPLFIEEEKDGSRKTYTGTAGSIDLPIAVLVNENSYSAAEYFAAVMQEYGRATVIGGKTTGKGYGQNTFELSDGSAVVLSTLRYYLPSGKTLKDSGMTPDKLIELPEDKSVNIGALDENDTQFAEAVKILDKNAA